MWSILLSLFSIFYFYTLINSKKLKVLIGSPNVGYSHLKFQGRLADLLVEAGHEAHILILMWDLNDYRNGTMKAQKVIRYFTKTKTRYDEIEWVKSPFEVNMIDPGQMEKILNFTGQNCLEMSLDQPFLDQLRFEKYDVAISEGFFACIFGIFEAAQIPIKILTSALPNQDGATDLMSIPMPRSYVPFLFQTPESTPHMSFLDILHNLHAHLMEVIFFYKPMIRNSNAYLSQALGLDFPRLGNIISDTRYYLLNTLSFLDFVRPINSKISYIGGISLPKISELDEKTLKILNTSKNGVVLFSFGTITDTDTMPRSMKMSFLEAFKNFPDYEFIWKFTMKEADQELFRKYPNVHTFDWINQSAILASPKLKGFITHGGLNSLTEAIFSGVPLLVIPLFGDQSYNAASVTRKGIGLQLTLKQISQEKLTQKLHELLNDPKYHQNSKKLKLQMESIPYKPADIFVKLVEKSVKLKDHNFHVLAGSKLNVFSHFGLDFFIIIILLVVIII